ncbi:MAG: citrate/2-methylcitrate synthase [Candidatus Methylumidiphilus sp.]
MPNKAQSDEFHRNIYKNMLVHEQLHILYRGFPRRAHPMAIMVGAVASLSAFYHDTMEPTTEEGREDVVYKIIAKMPTLAAMAYKYSLGLPTIYPKEEYGFAENFLHMLFANPMAEDEITHLAEPINVPDPIGRRLLSKRMALYYGTRESPAKPTDNSDPSIVLYVDGNEVPRTSVVACHLGDDGSAWAHEAPTGKYGIDPVLGRVAVAADLPEPDSLAVTYHYGFSADLGGGEYGRQREADASDVKVVQVPQDHETIQAALTALAGTLKGVVEITGSGRYKEAPSVQVPSGGQWTIRTAKQSWPSLELTGPMTVAGGKDSGFSLEGLRLSGNPLVIPATANELARLHISHSTLIPGLALQANGDPVSAGAVSLSVELADVAVTVDSSIMGAVWVDERTRFVANDSIIDANSPENIAYAATDGLSPGGMIAMEACTVIGKVFADAIDSTLNISNSIIFAHAPLGDTSPPVLVAKRQTGCVRFSYLPFASLVPRRYRCQPETAADEAGSAPRFTTLRYGIAAYCQLSRSTSEAIRRGADDESEMGAFHSLFPAQRETNLQLRLAEFLRVGLKAGIFYET